MPTRYLKPGIRDSDRINRVSSPDAEITYYRILVSVDDFGRCDARPLVIKSMCFPIRLYATADKCKEWMQDLVNAGLILVYEVDGKPYLQVTKWDNKPRAAASRFPPPPADIYNRAQMSANVPLTVTVTGTKTETNPSSGKPKFNGVETKQILEFLNTTAGKRFRPSKTNLDFIRCRLEDGITVDELRKIIVRKSREWLPDSKMRNYLRPATLFNRTQCEQYLGELVPPSQEKTKL
jgi:uncharacterized phage protein (TIGR02220 family)